jgi:hypothetical protein
MPIEGMPDPEVHRICRRCGKWFEPGEGALMAPEATGPMGAMRAARASFDPSLLRFQCNRCTRSRRLRGWWLWGTLLGLMALVLLAEKMGWLR